MRAAVLVALVAAALAQRIARQYDQPLLENAFLRAHVVTLNTVEHYRSSADAPQLLYCLGTFAVARSDGGESIERCGRGQVVFQESGWVDFKSDGDARPEMLVVEIKEGIHGDFFVARDDETKVAPDVFRIALDNPVVRAIDVQLGRGQRTRILRQPDRAFLLPLTSANVRLTTADGRVQNLALAARVPRWSLDGAEHIVENSGATDLRAILVELK